MTPRDVAHGTSCFAMLELLQGNMSARDAILSAGVALLQPFVVEQPRPDGSVRYGIHPLYDDCPSVYNSEGSSVRFTAARVLFRPTQAEMEARCGNAEHQRHQYTLPPFHLPAEFPTPFSGDSIECLRRKWKTFHDTFESWLLSRYWFLALGVHLDSLEHLADQRRFVAQLEIWHLTLHVKDQLSRMSSTTSSPADIDPVVLHTDSGKNGESDINAIFCDPLTTWRTYIQFYRLIMAVPNLGGATTDHDGSSYPDTVSALMLQDFEVKGLQRIIAHRRRELDGFMHSGSNDMFFDMSMLPVLSMQAATGQGIFRSSSGTGTDSSYDLPIPAESMTGLVIEKQLALVDLQSSLVAAEFRRLQGRQDDESPSPLSSQEKATSPLHGGEGGGEGQRDSYGTEGSRAPHSTTRSSREDFGFLPMSERERIVVAVVVPVLKAMTARHLRGWLSL
ncbi:hypothetical protein Micbo1qcDRAFT_157969 [Microdochium bolleyi]|uniref:Uncharacterized protein n=1 Tax=Microdochium bolleyi TaxID=196109 RepID=A0A136JFC9_9PEZI|nr:hypothetical protein Micbo1qcDRAFT_157969 [Microdochium bolleyi]